MKTLDEVIQKIEACIEADGHCPACPYEVSESCGDMDANALYYLREYRDECNNIINVHDDYIRLRDEMVEELNKKNPPLTWDELKTMTGKPVWVEDNIETPEDITKYWAIMWRIEKAEGDEYALLSEFYYPKSEYEKSWIAYRKERS